MADQATLRSSDSARPNGAAATARSDAGGNASAGSRPSGSAESDSGASGVYSNVAGFGENLLTLAELQTRLTAMEMRQNLDSLKTGGALMAAGSILAISTLPVIMIGCAELLVSGLGMNRGRALLGVVAAAIVIAGSAMAIARNWLVRNPFGFPVANEEFARNLNWLRTIIRHSGRSTLSR